MADHYCECAICQTAPTPEAVERVARAIYDSVNTMMSPAWDDALPNVQAIYELQARAALAAMKS